MDHSDIVLLISQGKQNEAIELIGARAAKDGISGEDAATLATLLGKSAETEVVAEEPADSSADSEPEPKAAKAVAKRPSRSAGKKGK